jgi:hypothetical protein
MKSVRLVSCPEVVLSDGMMVVSIQKWVMLRDGEDGEWVRNSHVYFEIMNSQSQALAGYFIGTHVEDILTVRLDDAQFTSAGITTHSSVLAFPSSETSLSYPAR